MGEERSTWSRISSRSLKFRAPSDLCIPSFLPVITSRGEIAIRVALGATYGRIVRLVVRDAAVLVGLGLLLGLGISAFVTQPLTTFLVTGLSARDPLSFVGTVVAFAVVSLLASWLPARRVARIDPALAMRLE